MWSNRTETTIFPQGFICTYNLVKLDRKEGKKKNTKVFIGGDKNTNASNVHGEWPNGSMTPPIIFVVQKI